MKEFTAEMAGIETAAALGTIRRCEELGKYGLYVGLDVHKETIAVAAANPTTREPTDGCRAAEFLAQRERTGACDHVVVEGQLRRHSN